MVLFIKRLLSRSNIQQRSVPKHIARPPYILYPDRPLKQTLISCKNDDEIDRMRHAGSIASRLRAYAGTLVKEGITTNEIDAVVHEKMIICGVYPSPLGFPASTPPSNHHFPKSICTSVDDVVCHGVPNDVVLKNGSIIKIDVSVFVDGVHGDCCGTFIVGDKLDPIGKALIETTNDALDDAIMACEVNAPYSIIGDMVSDVVSKTKFGIVEEFGGHGIGTDLHMLPHICHRRNGDSTKMKIGHTFTIEPMITEGNAAVYVADDGWSVTTYDRKRAAQVEETIVITKSGNGEIITDPTVWMSKWGAEPQI